MLLGKELKANLLIIDDYLAREYAKYLDFEITGTLGAILKAKEKRIIGEIKPLLSDLIDNGIYIGNKLFRDVLKLAEE
jgi:predicted nucleic acid-binding protein